MNQLVDDAPPRERAFATYVELTLLALLSFVATMPFSQLFDSRVVLALTGAAAILATGLNVVLTDRVSTSTMLLLGLLSLGAYLTFVVFHVDLPDPSALRNVWNGTTGSWADLLTAPVPAGSRPGLTATPVVVAWLGCEVASLLALRTRWITWPVVGPLGALTVALLFSPQQTISPALVVTVILLVLMFTLVRANRSGPRPRGVSTHGRDEPEPHRREWTAGQFGTGVAVVVVVAAMAAIIGVTLPFTEAGARMDLHDRYRAPFEVDDAVSPLSRVRAALEDTSDEPIFTVQFPDMPTGTRIDRVRGAVLDTYDGTVWGTDATFTAVGDELPAEADPTVPSVPVRQVYEMGDYRDGFLPFLDHPRSIGGDGLGFDRATGMIRPGTNEVDGLGYVVESLVPDYSEVGALPVQPGVGPATDPQVDEPPDGWPVAFIQFASAFPSQGSPYADLELIENELRSDHFGYDLQARPGHSLRVLEDFLTPLTGGDGLEAAHIGHDEQFAAAFAVLARVLHLPSRIVVGYRIDPDRAALGEPIPVLANDIMVWVEVHLNGIGWVPFDPIDRQLRQPVPPDDPPEIPDPDPQAGDDVVEGGRETGPSDPLSTTVTRKGTSAILVVLLAVVAGIVLAAGAIVGSKAAVRHARKTRGTNADRLLGAWHETRDRLRTHGFDLSRSSTVTELAANLDPDIASGLKPLGRLVDHALYAPSEPDDPAVTAAWEIEHALVDVMADHAAIRTRLKAAVDPRPLVDSIRRR